MAEGPLCAYCASPGSAKRCSLCREVAYCSQGCQQAHWKEGHKRTCSRQYTPSAPSKPAPPKNPCVNCGKEGKKELGGQWFCSHDCTGGNLASLTDQVKRLSQPPQLPSCDDQRIMDWIKGTVDTPPKVSDVSPPEMSKPEISASKLGRKQEALLPESQSEPCGVEQNTLDKVRSLLEAGPKAPSPEQLRQGGDDQKTLDKVKSMLEAPQDDQTTVDKVKSMLGVPQAAPQAAPQESCPVFDKVKGLIEASERSVLQGVGTEEMKSEVAENKFTAQENQRVADWIRGICSQTPEETYAAANRQAEAGTPEPPRIITIDGGPAPKARTSNLQNPIVIDSGPGPKIEEIETSGVDSRGQAPKDEKPKTRKQKSEKKQDAPMDELSRQIKEIDAKKEELRKANIEVEKAKEKQVQMSHYMRGWLQREAEKQAEAEADEDVNELD